MIDEVVLQNLYDELFPHVEESHGEKRILVYRSQETDELEELLERFHGNRNWWQKSSVSARQLSGEE